MNCLTSFETTAAHMTDAGLVAEVIKPLVKYGRPDAPHPEYAADYQSLFQHIALAIFGERNAM